MKFVKIEPGTFMMGSAPLTTYDRDTQHQVILTQGFYIQTTEVTQEQWEAIGLSNSSFFKGDLNLPVEGVSWIEIQEFIKQLNKKGEGLYRLPTEAEWEYSARSGSETSYSCGENKTCVEDIGWYINNANGKSHPVAQKQPNSWGLYDMHGNVFEWVQDWYQFNIHPNDPKTDPKGPLSGSERILKGGSFSSGGESLRLGNTTTKQPGDHGYFSPDFRFDYYGFRLVREL